MPIASRLAINFILIILLISIIFTGAGIQLIGSRVVAEAQEKVSYDLNAAREIYGSKANRIYDAVRLTAGRFFITDALTTGDMAGVAEELVKLKTGEGLDIFTLTDAKGKVIMRANNLEAFGDNQNHNELIAVVLSRNAPVTATVIVSLADLRMESALLAEQAFFKFIDTPMARIREGTEETNGMVLGAAAPIFDSQGYLLGVLYGGVLLNRNFEIVDKIKQTVFQGMKYKGEDIGTATIFQEDVRISTNVKNEDGSRAIGTRVAEEVYDQVVLKGEAWIGRAYVVNNWYITAYEPIRDINNMIIGMLYVGILEQKYLDIREQTAITFLSITLAGMFFSMLLSYLISLRISVPIKNLASASREVARGNLNAKVDVASKDELGELSDTFNTMALALKERDERLKEFARNKIMESERLALIGQLSANVAHELNNPLQGIVTYSHLLLEEVSDEDPSKDFLQKIVVQANRCRDIIRGLLDFSRQRKPDKTLCDVNSVLSDCVSLLENQALFHNIQIINVLDDNLPLAIIDPSQIERVFMNIIINAAQAMDGNGQLTLATRFEAVERFIVVEFTNTGPEIAKENMEKIFDPFFTTKETGHGVGLGLAISFGIIKEHNGTISVESGAGNNTTFTVRLPVTANEGVASQ